MKGVQAGGPEVAVAEPPRLGGRAAAGIGLGIVAGRFAQSLTDSYGEDESSPLRVTAHATVPFLVLASMLTDRGGADVAVAFRGGFLGAHFVHMRQIARLVRAHGTGEWLIRVELTGGSLLYAMVALQTVLLTRQMQAWVGIRTATRLSRRIDTGLLGVYFLASLSGLVRYRRPLPVYAALTALLVGSLTSRMRCH